MANKNTEESGFRNLITAFGKIFSNTKPNEFRTRKNVEDALAASNREIATKPVIDPTKLSNKGVGQGQFIFGYEDNKKEFHKYIERESLRHARYNMYDRMDADLIASALDVYANEATQKNTQNTVIGVFSKSKYIKDELSRMLSDTQLNNARSWMILRNMCKYGDHFCALKLDSVRGVTGVLDLDPASIHRIEVNGVLEGYVQDVGLLRQVDHENPSVSSINPYINLNTLSIPMINRSKAEEASEDDYVTFLNYELVHFRIRGRGQFLPYGSSILEPCLDTWKKLDLLFDSLIIYRLNRAPSRLIFYIDVGNNQGADAEALVKKQINAINKKEYYDARGKINERYNLLDMNANFYIPIQKNSNSKVELLQGDSNIGQIEDVAFLNNRLFSALKVPKAFLGFEGDVSGKGLLSQQNVTFGKAIQNIQEDFLETVKDMCLIHLAIRGISSAAELNSFDLVMTRASYVEEKARLEVESESLNLANNYVSFGVDKKWIAKNVLRRTDSEIEEMFPKGTQAQPEEAGMGSLGGGMTLGGGGLDLGAGLGGGEIGAIPPAPGQEQPALGAAPTPELGATPAPTPEMGGAPLVQNRIYSGDLLVETHNTIFPVIRTQEKAQEVYKLLLTENFFADKKLKNTESDNSDENVELVSLNESLDIKLTDPSAAL